ncbi:Chaperone protein like [Actinidia chinensis var. chinensis]|uniref:Chaperone protein like n=1 Tax=Actinidia chinensis var. chinensis TaxID=1590841 RepID=A0A2R6RP66_ACTCC|nr:Chaperone protein like [Actinidia chinensis var. chinensis]
MAKTSSICCNWNWMTLPALPIHPQLNLRIAPTSWEQHRGSTIFTSFAAKSSGFSVIKNCKTCRGKGAVDCPGCKGTGKNKKNGNIFERWKCYDCQGFGLKGCPSCGQGKGLTPEQRGER